MFTLRPAFPRGAYVLGAIVSVFLVLVSVNQPAVPVSADAPESGPTASEQTLVMDFAR